MLIRYKKWATPDHWLLQIKVYPYLKNNSVLGQRFYEILGASKLNFRWNFKALRSGWSLIKFKEGTIIFVYKHFPFIFKFVFDNRRYSCVRGRWTTHRAPLSSVGFPLLYVISSMYLSFFPLVIQFFVFFFFRDEETSASIICFLWRKSY